MTRIIKFALGAAVVLVLVATYVIVHNDHSGGYTVRVMLADAGGLESGSDVNVNGVTVGRVTRLDVTKRDQALAVLELNRNAVPIGAGATALVQIEGFFGERILDLTRGAYRTEPEPSGTTIPVSRSGVSVRLDQVLDALNMDAQGALQTFLDEDGAALVGRGQSLSALLAQLPQTLPQLTTLLSQFSSNQQALGDLVQRSDQVVTQVAGQRSYLASLVNSGSSALRALASRRNQLGSTVQRAPGTLAQAERTLAKLQGTAIPLAPAADGLRETAPRLVTALDQVPSFTSAAVPTLDEISAVAPALSRLAADGTPIVSQIVPLAKTLTSYSADALSPLLTLLDQKGGAADLFGEMEGWARSTQGYDAAGHIFRFGATVSPQSFAQLLSLLSVPGLPSLTSSASSTKPSEATQSSPSSSPALSGVTQSVSGTASNVTKGVPGLVTAVGNGVSGTINTVAGTVSGVVNKLHGAGSSNTSTTPSQSGASGSGNLSSLLGYLLGK